MPTVTRNDPYPGHNFQSSSPASATTAAPSAVPSPRSAGSRSSIERDRVPQRQRGHHRPQDPGPEDLHQPRRASAGRPATSSSGTGSRRRSTGQVQRADGSIILQDENQAEVMRWNFSRGWPCKYTGRRLTPPTMGGKVRSDVTGYICDFQGRPRRRAVVL